MSTVRKGRDHMRNSGFGYALGMGVAGTIVGMYIGSMSKPNYQKEVRRSFQKASNEFSDLVSDLGDTLHDLASR